METFLFPSGPHIKVSILSKKVTLTKVILSHSNCFCCEISRDLPEEIRKELYLWLLTYSQRKENKFPHLKLDTYPPFTIKVLEQLALVPFGCLESYSGLAKKAGSERGARAVGNICRGNPFPLLLPCHRIVPIGGSIGGFAYGTDMKLKLLAFEKST